MFVIGNFLVAVAVVLDLALSIYMWMIIIRAVISWFVPLSRSPFLYSLIHGLDRITEPVLGRIRRIFRFRGMGLDISPVIAIMVILFIQYFFVATLRDIGHRL
jgi:YggT family protein